MGDIYFVDDSEYKNPETLALHGGNYRFDPVTSAVTVPIYRSTSFQFRDTENAANLFALQEFGNIYSRIMNPSMMLWNKDSQPLREAGQHFQ